ncbi:MAG: glycosyltransferase [Candidatus Omnitrophota bacterium]|jgi:cellulose synthase/poly-beta-1,6-N-acetylglucosamine synthase-like glycosyltransferase
MYSRPEIPGDEIALVDIQYFDKRGNITHIETKYGVNVDFKDHEKTLREAVESPSFRRAEYVEYKYNPDGTRTMIKNGYDLLTGAKNYFESSNETKADENGMRDMIDKTIHDRTARAGATEITYFKKAGDKVTEKRSLKWLTGDPTPLSISEYSCKDRDKNGELIWDRDYYKNFKTGVWSRTLERKAVGDEKVTKEEGVDRRGRNYTNDSGVMRYHFIASGVYEVDYEGSVSSSEMSGIRVKLGNTKEIVFPRLKTGRDIVKKGSKIVIDQNNLLVADGTAFDGTFFNFPGGYKYKLNLPEAKYKFTVTREFDKENEKIVATKFERIVMTLDDKILFKITLDLKTGYTEVMSHRNERKMDELDGKAYNDVMETVVYGRNKEVRSTSYHRMVYDRRYRDQDMWVFLWSKGIVPEKVHNYENNTDRVVDYLCTKSIFRLPTSGRTVIDTKEWTDENTGEANCTTITTQKDPFGNVINVSSKWDVNGNRIAKIPHVYAFHAIRAETKELKVGDRVVGTVRSNKKGGLIADFAAGPHGQPFKSYPIPQGALWIVQSKVDTIKNENSFGIYDAYGKPMYQDIVTHYYGNGIVHQVLVYNEDTSSMEEHTTYRQKESDPEILILEKVSRILRQRNSEIGDKWLLLTEESSKRKYVTEYGYDMDRALGGAYAGDKPVLSKTWDIVNNKKGALIESMEYSYGGQLQERLIIDRMHRPSGDGYLAETETLKAGQRVIGLVTPIAGTLLTEKEQEEFETQKWVGTLAEMPDGRFWIDSVEGKLSVYRVKLNDDFYITVHLTKDEKTGRHSVKSAYIGKGVYEFYGVHGKRRVREYFEIDKRYVEVNPVNGFCKTDQYTGKIILVDPVTGKNLDLSKEKDVSRFGTTMYLYDQADSNIVFGIPLTGSGFENGYFYINKMLQDGRNIPMARFKITPKTGDRARDLEDFLKRSQVSSSDVPSAEVTAIKPEDAILHGIFATSINNEKYRNTKTPIVVFFTDVENGIVDGKAIAYIHPASQEETGGIDERYGARMLVKKDAKHQLKLDTNGIEKIQSLNGVKTAGGKPISSFVGNKDKPLTCRVEEDMHWSKKLITKDTIGALSNETGVRLSGEDVDGKAVFYQNPDDTPNKIDFQIGENLLERKRLTDLLKQFQPAHDYPFLKYPDEELLDTMYSLKRKYKLDDGQMNKLMGCALVVHKEMVSLYDELGVNKNNYSKFSDIFFWSIDRFIRSGNYGDLEDLPVVLDKDRILRSIIKNIALEIIGQPSTATEVKKANDNVLAAIFTVVRKYQETKDLYETRQILQREAGITFKAGKIEVKNIYTIGEGGSVSVGGSASAANIRINESFTVAMGEAAGEFETKGIKIKNIVHEDEIENMAPQMILATAVTLATEHLGDVIRESGDRRLTSIWSSIETRRGPPVFIEVAEENFEDSNVKERITEDVFGRVVKVEIILSRDFADIIFASLHTNRLAMGALSVLGERLFHAYNHKHALSKSEEDRTEDEVETLYKDSILYRGVFLRNKDVQESVRAFTNHRYDRNHQISELLNSRNLYKVLHGQWAQIGDEGLLKQNIRDFVVKTTKFVKEEPGVEVKNMAAGMGNIDQTIERINNFNNFLGNLERQFADVVNARSGGKRAQKLVQQGQSRQALELIREKLLAVQDIIAQNNAAAGAITTDSVGEIAMLKRIHGGPGFVGEVCNKSLNQSLAESIAEISELLVSGEKIEAAQVAVKHYLRKKSGAELRFQELLRVISGYRQVVRYEALGDVYRARNRAEDNVNLAHLMQEAKARRFKAQAGMIDLYMKYENEDLACFVWATPVQKSMFILVPAAALLGLSAVGWLFGYPFLVPIAIAVNTAVFLGLIIDVFKRIIGARGFVARSTALSKVFDYNPPLNASDEEVASLPRETIQFMDPARFKALITIPADRNAQISTYTYNFREHEINVDGVPVEILRSFQAAYPELYSFNPAGRPEAEIQAWKENVINALFEVTSRDAESLLRCISAHSLVEKGIVSVDLTGKVTRLIDDRDDIINSLDVNDRFTIGAYHLLPLVTVYLPVFNEPNVVGKLVRNVSNLNYPKIQVLISGEEGDEATITPVLSMLERNRVPEFLNFRIVATPIRAPSDIVGESPQPQTKPYATDYGVGYTKGEYAVIWDGEDAPGLYQVDKVIFTYQRIHRTLRYLEEILRDDACPEPNKLTKENFKEYLLSLPATPTRPSGKEIYDSVFRFGINLHIPFVIKMLELEHVEVTKDSIIEKFKQISIPAVIQCQLDWFNWYKSWTTKNFSADYEAWFKLLLPGLNATGTLIPLGGTSNYFYVPTLLDLGGWDGFNVTEDEHLGMELWKRGYRTAVLFDNTLEEAIPEQYWQRWVNQRSRWTKGYMQTLVKFMTYDNMRSIYKSRGATGVWEFFVMIAGGAVSALFFMITAGTTLFWGLSYLPQPTLAYPVSYGIGLTAAILIAIHLWYQISGEKDDIMYGPLNKKIARLKEKVGNVKGGTIVWASGIALVAILTLAIGYSLGNVNFIAKYYMPAIFFWLAYLPQIFIVIAVFVIAKSAASWIYKGTKELYARLRYNRSPSRIAMSMVPIIYGVTMLAVLAYFAYLPISDLSIAGWRANVVEIYQWFWHVRLKPELAGPIFFLYSFVAQTLYSQIAVWLPNAADRPIRPGSKVSIGLEKSASDLESDANSYRIAVRAYNDNAGAMGEIMNGVGEYANLNTDEARLDAMVRYLRSHDDEAAVTQVPILRNSLKRCIVDRSDVVISHAESLERDAGNIRTGVLDMATYAYLALALAIPAIMINLFYPGFVPPKYIALSFIAISVLITIAGKASPITAKKVSISAAAVFNVIYMQSLIIGAWIGLKEMVCGLAHYWSKTAHGAEGEDVGEVVIFGLRWTHRYNYGDTSGEIKDNRPLRRFSFIEFSRFIIKTLVFTVAIWAIMLVGARRDYLYKYQELPEVRARYITPYYDAFAGRKFIEAPTMADKLKWGMLDQKVLPFPELPQDVRADIEAAGDDPVKLTQALRARLEDVFSQYDCYKEIFASFEEQGEIKEKGLLKGHLDDLAYFAKSPNGINGKEAQRLTVLIEAEYGAYVAIIRKQVRDWDMTEATGEGEINTLRNFITESMGAIGIGFEFDENEFKINVDKKAPSTSTSHNLEPVKPIGIFTGGWLVGSLISLGTIAILNYLAVAHINPWLSLGAGLGLSLTGFYLAGKKHAAARLSIINIKANREGLRNGDWYSIEYNSLKLALSELYKKEGIDINIDSVKSLIWTAEEMPDNPFDAFMELFKTSPPKIATSDRINRTISIAPSLLWPGNEKTLKRILRHEYAHLNGAEELGATYAESGWLSIFNLRAVYNIPLLFIDYIMNLLAPIEVRPEIQPTAPPITVAVKPFTSERGPSTTMAVAGIRTDEVTIYPVFQKNLAESRGMQRDRVPMHFGYRLENGEFQDVNDVAPDFKNVRKDVWTIERHLAEFRKDHPDVEVLGFVGNGNILANPGLASYVGGRLYAIEQERNLIHSGESGKYPSLIMWKDGRYSIEEVSFTPDEKVTQVSTGKNITEDVIFTNSGIGLLKSDGNGNAMPYSVEDNYRQHYEVRNYLDFPFMPSFNTHFGVSQFYADDGSLIPGFLVCAVSRPITLNLEMNKAPLSEDQIEELRTGLTEKGYKPAKSDADVAYGTYYISKGLIKIGFMRGINPHNICGIDADGNLVFSMVVAGKSNKVGITFKEAQSELENMGVVSAIALDSGGDAMMNIGGNFVVPSFMGRDRLTSLLIFGKSSQPQPKSPALPAARNILAMSSTEILGFANPKYNELKKHSVADWNYARPIALELGYAEDSEFMNNLRVVCFAHDIGGMLGYEPDTDVESSLLKLARDNSVQYMGRNPQDVVDEFSRKGVLLTPAQARLVPVMDHGNNSLRILDNAGVKLPDDVRFVISRHMTVPSEKEIAGWSKERRDLYACLAISDSFEFGNNYYKKNSAAILERLGKPQFEAPEDTLSFLTNRKFASVPSLQAALNAAEGIIVNSQFGAAVAYSRSPLNAAEFASPARPQAPPICKDVTLTDGLKFKLAFLPCRGQYKAAAAKQLQELMAGSPQALPLNHNESLCPLCKEKHGTEKYFVVPPKSHFAEDHELFVSTQPRPQVITSQDQIEDIAKFMEQKGERYEAIFNSLNPERKSLAHIHYHWQVFKKTSTIWENYQNGVLNNRHSLEESTDRVKVEYSTNRAFPAKFIIGSDLSKIGEIVLKDTQAISAKSLIPSINFTLINGQFAFAIEAVRTEKPASLIEIDNESQAGLAAAEHAGYIICDTEKLFNALKDDPELIRQILIDSTAPIEEALGKRAQPKAPPSIAILIPEGAEDVRQALGESLGSSAKVFTNEELFKAETARRTPGIVINGNIRIADIKNPDFKLYVEAIQTIAADKNGEKLRRFVNFLKKKLDLMDKFDIDTAKQRLLSKGERMSRYTKRINAILPVLLREQQTRLARAYSAMAPSEGQFNNQVAVGTTDTIAENDIYLFDKIIKASKQGIVSPIIYGNKIKTLEDATAFARAGLRVQGLNEGSIDEVMKSIVFIDSKNGTKARNDIVMEIQSEVYKRFGTTLDLYNDIGIRANDNELMNAGQGPVLGKFIEIKPVTINGEQVYVSINTYEITLEVVTKLKGTMTLEGLAIPGLKIDERGRIVFTSPIVPYDYNKEIGAYRDAMILLAAAA